MKFKINRRKVVKVFWIILSAFVALMMVAWTFIR